MGIESVLGWASAAVATASALSAVLPPPDATKHPVLAKLDRAVDFVALVFGNAQKAGVVPGLTPQQQAVVDAAQKLIDANAKKPSP